jgi:phosphate transport system permease protein
MRNWYKSGEPWVWTTAGAVALSLVAVYAVVGSRPRAAWATSGPSRWPRPPSGTRRQHDQADRRDARARGSGGARLREQGFEVEARMSFNDRYLIKLGNKDVTGVDFKWFRRRCWASSATPDLLTVERREWGNFYGHLKAVVEDGKVVAEGPRPGTRQKRLARSNDLFKQILRIEKVDIGKINYAWSRCGWANASWKSRTTDRRRQGRFRRAAQG